MNATEYYIYNLVIIGLPILVLIIASLIIYFVNKEKNDKYNPYE